MMIVRIAGENVSRMPFKKVMQYLVQKTQKKMKFGKPLKLEFGKPMPQKRRGIFAHLEMKGTIAGHEELHAGGGVATRSFHGNTGSSGVHKFARKHREVHGAIEINHADKNHDGKLNLDEFLAAGLGTKEDFVEIDDDGDGEIDMDEYHAHEVIAQQVQNHRDRIEEEKVRTERDALAKKKEVQRRKERLLADKKRHEADVAAAKAREKARKKEKKQSRRRKWKDTQKKIEAERRKNIMQETLKKQRDADAAAEVLMAKMAAQRLQEAQQVAEELEHHRMKSEKQRLNSLRMRRSVLDKSNRRNHTLDKLKARAFKLADANNSGKLDLSEFLAARLGTAEDFKAFDDDGDGEISLEEWQAHAHAIDAKRKRIEANKKRWESKEALASQKQSKKLSQDQKLAANGRTANALFKRSVQQNKDTPKKSLMTRARGRGAPPPVDDNLSSNAISSSSDENNVPPPAGDNNQGDEGHKPTSTSTTIPPASLIRKPPPSHKHRKTHLTLVLREGDSLGMKVQNVPGAKFLSVTAVQPGSSAAKCGVIVHDYLAKINGKRIPEASVALLMKTLKTAKRPIKIDLSREHACEVTVSLLPDLNGSNPNFGFTAGRMIQEVISAGEHAHKDKSRTSVHATCWITHVVPGGVADKAGIKTHDDLLKVNDTDVTAVASTAVLNKVLAKESSEGKPVRLCVQRHSGAHHHHRVHLQARDARKREMLGGGSESSSSYSYSSSSDDESDSSGSA
jgi:hypothetical protein